MSIEQSFKTPRIRLVETNCNYGFDPSIDGELSKISDELNTLRIVNDETGRVTLWLSSDTDSSELQSRLSDIDVSIVASNIVL